MEKINLAEKLSLIDTYWDPKVIGELNQQQLRLVKFKGEFVWHKHINEDELFLVLKGSFDMQFRDKIVTVSEDEFIIVPRKVEHCPKAATEVHVLLFEPAITVNTGDAGGDRTITDLQKI